MNAPIQAGMQTIGWTLIHFVWQGGLLAVVTAAGLRWSRHRSSEARYAIACVGLTAMLAAPAITAAVSWVPPAAELSGASGAPAASASEGHAIGQTATNDAAISERRNRQRATGSTNGFHWSCASGLRA